MYQRLLGVTPFSYIHFFIYLLVSDDFPPHASRCSSRPPTTLPPPGQTASLSKTATLRPLRHGYRLPGAGRVGRSERSSPPSLRGGPGRRARPLPYGLCATGTAFRGPDGSVAASAPLPLPPCGAVRGGERDRYPTASAPRVPPSGGRTGRSQRSLRSETVKPGPATYLQGTRRRYSWRMV